MLLQPVAEVMEATENDSQEPGIIIVAEDQLHNMQVIQK